MPLLAQNLATHGNTQITAQDLSLSSPSNRPEGAINPLRDPVQVHQTVSNMLVRRVLADEAAKQGLEQDPRIQLAIAQARERVLSDALLAKLDEASRPSAAEAEAYARNVYNANQARFVGPEEVRVKHLLAAKSQTGAEQKAQVWLRQLKQGISFDDIAKAESDDKSSSARGGDVGFLPKGRMPAALDEAAFALKQPGELTAVIETSQGFHIMQLVERRPAGQRSFEEVKERLIRDAQSAVVNNARLRKQDEILAGAQFNPDAIQAFAEKQR